MSYYALFKWVAASEPTSWLFTQNHIVFHLTISLGPYLTIWALSLLTTELSSRSLTPEFPLHGIRSLIEFSNLVGPYLIQCSTPKCYETRLVLKLFRGEPAISEFDWNFSANHTSSRDFLTSMSSDLHLILLKLHPGHG